jgi:tRNA (cmo5U34)-methyltransferase
MPKNDNTTAHKSSEYDIQVRKTIPYYENIHSETIRFVKAVGIEPALWLDAGCGTGSFVEKALAVFPGATFVLSDPSEQMLKIAKKKLEKKKGWFRFIPPVTTQDLKMSGSPDIITAIQSHHYLQAQQRVRATAVCFNLLRPGGMYITFENISPMTEDGIKIGKKYWKSFQVSAGRTEKEADKHMERFGKEYFPITIEEHLALLRDCGFKAVEIFWYSYMQAGFYAIK